MIIFRFNGHLPNGISRNDPSLHGIDSIRRYESSRISVFLAAIDFTSGIA
jgi:hypothetical protein